MRDIKSLGIFIDIMNHEGQKQKSEDKLTGEEIAKHNTKDDCWVIVHGRAYDVTEFMPGITVTISVNGSH